MKNIIKLNKQYKKIILLIVLFFCFQNISFAETQKPNECYIENWPAKVLQQYLDNVDKVLVNVTSQAKSKASEKDFLGKIADIAQFDKFKTQSIRFYNWITSWDWYLWSFDFYAVYPVYTHVPYPVKRDYKLIENNINYLWDYYENLITNWVGDLVIENPCEWVENCNLSWKSIDIISKLIENSGNILSMYSSNITNHNISSKEKFILVPSNFKDEFWKYYNAFTSEDCSNSEWNRWFFDTIEKSWEKISVNNILSKNAIKDWTNSIDLALWKKSLQDQYEIEHKLLSEELSRQWVDWNNAEIILWNLSDSYNKPLSFGNNPIVNSVKNTFNGNFGASRQSWTSFWERWSWFSEAIYQTYKKYQESFWVWNSTQNIQINDINKINQEIIKSKDIEKRITDIYNIELPFAEHQDINNENLQSRIIELHIQLSQAINTLDKTTPTAEKLCNTQSVWQWKCNYSN